MNWTNFVTYGDSYQEAFETLCTQLFERFLKRIYKDDLVKFRVVNGAGGDGGVEAYGELKSGDIIAVQAKWIPDVIKAGEVSQMRDSVETARAIRSKIKEYFICVPRAINSIKFGRGKKGEGKKPIGNSEEKTIEEFTEEMEEKFPDLNINWWFEQDIELQLLKSDNEGVHKFWFEKELISLKYLINQFDLQKSSWLFNKYTPELHGQGVIQKEVQQLLYDQNFRKGLFKKFNSKLTPLKNSIDLITKYIQPLDPTDNTRQNLETIKNVVVSNLDKAVPVGQSILDGKTHFDNVSFSGINIQRYLLDEIEKTNPSNIQLGVKERLLDTLIQIGEINLTNLFEELRKESQQTSRLFLGNPGTGKTHALSNTVDNHLNKSDSPAIIIRAKGTPCANWTEIFKKALELEGWDKNQVLSAMETLATRNDNKEANKLGAYEELNKEPTKVIICIDGVEEDTTHWSDWYERIRESRELIKNYQRVRFVYSARKYFLDEKELPDVPGFKITYIPDEGDVPVLQVIDNYFSPENYNIQVTPKSLIRGIDSLYALRLFCELYKGQTLNEKSAIITAEKQLLNEKVNRINTEFKGSLSSIKVSTRNPIREALVILSETFYQQAEIEHGELFDKLNSEIGKYLNKEEIDKLMDYLSNNGFLIKNAIPTGIGILTDIKHSYSLSYQSIMELIMADKYAMAIASGQLDKIPSHLLATWIDTTDENTDHLKNTHLLNQRIIQNIADTLFHEHGKLIGEKNYLIEGLDGALVLELQLNALRKAPAEIAEKYKQRINELFYRDYKSRSFIFNELIYPSANSAANYFGADYLHKLLFDQPSAFEREEKWLGGDRYGVNEQDIPFRERFDRFDLQNTIDPYPDEELQLSEFALHNEHPLIFGWALATLNQSFRERLRVALTRWGLKQPLEFIALLDKLFSCNDPQIQEDLASITLGLASKLKDKEVIKLLAQWSLKNVFSHPQKYRNLIIREGFRSIVERAVQYVVLNEEEASSARPEKLDPILALPLDEAVIKNPREEIYPIVHDLAWYVIKRAFDDFFKYSFTSSDDENHDTLNEFKQAYAKVGIQDMEEIGTHAWAMAAAIAYMEGLGFSRTAGNGWTQASHGSKSKIFTLEEKYTWLAVHYIQGYLSDYLPLKDSNEFIKDYSQITDIPNPAEFIDTVEIINKNEREHTWIIKEELAPKPIEIPDYDEAIKMAIEQEPVIDFSKWLRFQKTDIITDGTQENLLSIFNYTSLHDTKEFLYSSIDVRGVIIEKGQSKILLDLMLNHHNRVYFVEHIDGLVGSPLTDTYSNPTDIVWMSWIGEQEYAETYYTLEGEEKSMLYTVTSITRNTVGGENEIYIPSKFVRSLLKLTELNGDLLFNNLEQVKGYLHMIKRENYDRQEMVLVTEKDFIDALKNKGLEIVWLIDLFSSKNALNDSIKSDKHPRKTRKYFVYFEGDGLIATKIWDARSSNMRDKPSKI